MIIKNDDLRPEFTREITAIHGAEYLRRCYQCGACSSGCPVVRVTDAFNPQVLMRMAQMGLEEMVMNKKSPVWLCTTCYNCAEWCPMDANPTEVFLAMKTIAARRKFIPMGRKMAFSTLAKKGRVFDVKKQQQEERVELGMEPAPEVDIEKTTILLKLTGAYKILTGGK
jgi:heterodisulfide reductase subunit C